MKQIIGITGGIASGKSNVCSVIRNLGYKVIDCDKITHELYKKGNSIYNAIIDVFGKEYLDSNLEIDRKKLASYVFNNKEALKLLNETTHPFILNEINREINLIKDDIIFIDIPLLYEAKLENLVNKVICVYLDKELQIERLMARDNISREYALVKIHNQMDLKIKKDKADYVIDSKGTIDETNALVKTIINKIKGE